MYHIEDINRLSVNLHHCHIRQAGQNILFRARNTADMAAFWKAFTVPMFNEYLVRNYVENTGQSATARNTE